MPRGVIDPVGEPTTITLLVMFSNMLLNSHGYTYRVVLPSAIVDEASYYRKKQSLEKSIIGHSAENR